MQIQYLAHSCFVLTNGAGKRLLFDPFDDTVGYAVPAVRADVTCTSHDHFDHGATAVMENPGIIVNTPGVHEAAGYKITALESFHDSEEGAQRGKNLMMKVESDGLCVAHLGDLGHLLEGRAIVALSDLDALFIPIGGTFTIDAQQAAATVRALAPKVVIPMHYKTPECDFPITPLEPFLELLREMEVERAGNVFTLGADTPAGTIVVMDYHW